MYLNKNCFTTIAMFADYDTTVSMLCALPLKNIWQDKWQFLYPNKTYFNFFTLKENYLLKENSYLLSYTNKEELVISALLIQKPIFDNDQLNLIKMLADIQIKYINVNVDKQFIVFRTEPYHFHLLFQDDCEINCRKKIKEYLQIDNDPTYIVIDVSKLTFTKFKKHVPIQCYHKYNIYK